MTIRDIAIAFGFTVDEASAKKAEGAVTKLKSFATKALATIGIGISLTQMNKLVEEWYSVNKVLANVNTQLKDQSAVQNRITEAANACRITYAEMCGYATSLVKTGSRFFSTVEDATDFLELANKAFKVSGASEAQMNSLNNVLKNTFQTGKLSAGGFNTIMLQSPDIIQYLADSLGVSMQQVKALGLSGSITAKQLKNAFTQSAEGIESAYGKLRLTVSDALRIIRNEFGTWLYQTDEGLNLTNDIAKFLIRAFRSLLGVLKALVNSFQRLVNLLGSTRRAAALVAAAVGGVVFGGDKAGAVWTPGKCGEELRGGVVGVDYVVAPAHEPLQTYDVARVIHAAVSVAEPVDGYACIGDSLQQWGVGAVEECEFHIGPGLFEAWQQLGEELFSPTHPHGGYDVENHTIAQV